jgi:hypothetical protein
MNLVYSNFLILFRSSTLPLASLLRVLKIKEKGGSFVVDEATRVKKLLDEKVSETKKQTLELRRNILASFNRVFASKKDEL